VVVQKAKIAGSFTNWGVTFQGMEFVCDPIEGVADGVNLTLRWKAAGGKLTPTRIRYSNSFFKVGNSRIGDPYAWSAPSSTAPAGTSTVTGSYAGSGSSRAVLFSDTFSHLPPRACAGLAGPTVLKGDGLIVIEV
jgi:hypothetical protein